MTAVAYARVSTEEQVNQGVSLQAQEERLRAYCTMAGLELIHILREEGISGSVPLLNRPAGQHIASAIRSQGVRHVVALKLARLFRDAEDALHQTRAWDRAGVSLHLVDLGGNTINSASPMVECSSR